MKIIKTSNFDHKGLQPLKSVEYEAKQNLTPDEVKLLQKKICMFCGQPLVPLDWKPGKNRPGFTSWYGGCHDTCLSKYNGTKR